MQFLNRIITRRFPSSSSSSSSYCNLPKYLNLLSISNPRVFSTDESTGSGDIGWDDDSTSWSTGLTKDHFNGDAVGHQVTPPPYSEAVGGGYGGGGIFKATTTQLRGPPRTSAHFAPAKEASENAENRSTSKDPVFTGSYPNSENLVV
ncbi:hypothetical protein RND81_09G028500 [Saponaria officinalis]|uniref:Uncharacterized protein n=1 Tax=Saponaria officinalis TaxID=3572 RepID=A0AAW1II16_SAPOF